MSQGWTPQKVAAFKAAFFEFLKHVKINSKEKGGGYVLASGVYEAQHRFIDGVFSALAQDKHDVKCLKSRQLGISTIAEALFVFLLGMIPGVQAAVCLDSAPHVKSARIRVKNIIQQLPASLGYPKIIEDSRENLLLEGGAKVVWLSAGVRETESSGNLGRGEGINLLWASEVSSWKNEEGIESLQNTLSETFPDRLFIYESTARGYNAWRDMWMDAKADDLNQVTIFLGWWSHPGHVIARDNPRFQRYGAAPPTAEEQTMIDQVDQRHAHKITPEELAWYRYKRDPQRDLEGGEKKSGQFKQQEQCSLEEEAFTQAGSSFFDHIALNMQTKRLVSYAAPKRYHYLFGQEFPETIIVDAIQHRQTKLRVWDPPQPTVQYIVAADPAFGRNPDNDRSACQVIACYADCVEQVAEFACPTTNTDQFAWVIASLAAWYGLKGSVEVVIEIDGPGEAVWKAYEAIPRLVKSSYLRHTAEARGLVDVFNNVRNYIFSRPDSIGGKGNNWQWKTGNRKEAIMERLKVVTNNGTLIIKSMETIEEMRKIARDGASIEAPSHKHDDRALALAIAVRAWDDSVRPALVAKGFTKEAFDESLKMTSPAKYNIYMQNTITGMFKQSQALHKQAQRQARMNAYNSRGRR